MNFSIRSVAYVLAGSLSLAILPIQILAGAGQDDPPQSEKPAEIRVIPDSSEPTTLDQGGSINPKLLVVVDDNAAGIASAERDVYFRGLKLAQETPLQKQKDAASQLQEHRRRSDPKYAQVPIKDFPQYVDLFQNPTEYRGRPVSLRGTIRRLTKYDPGKNSQGISEVYEGWVYTADSNSNPAVIIFTTKPAELALGSDTTDEIGVTGYFFKQYGYEAQGGPGKAPLLLAGTVEWHPGPGHFVFKPWPVSAYVILTIVLAALGYGVWSASRPADIQKLLPPGDTDIPKPPSVDDPS